MTIQPTAFDRFAPTYDVEFTHSWLGQTLRQRVWAVLADQFQPGDHVLELTCGTGEDACWLARRGVRVTATDGAAEMVRLAQAKAVRAGLGERVTGRQLALQEVGQLAANGAQFDGIFSNFGGLNTIDEWRSLAESLAGCVKLGGKAILVPMGPLCPWELVWYGGHGQIGLAWRRFRQPAVARIGETTIPIWYPSTQRLQADFSPQFRHLSTQSLGLWLPPSYLDHLTHRWPRLFAMLSRWEQATARLSGGWGDHYISVFERIG